MTDIAALRQQIREVRGETRELKASLSEVTYVVLEFNRAARLAGLPPEISQGISMLLRLKLAAQAAYASIMLVYKGTGPIGWTLATLSLVSSAIVVYDTMTMEATY